MTVQDLILATAKLAKIVSKSELLAPDEEADIFLRLKSMLDAWQIERLTIFQVVNTVINCVSGQQSYTIGPGGNINIARPVWIQDASVISLANPLQPVELPVRILTDDEWASVTVKNVPSGLFWYLYYDYGLTAPNGTGTIKLWPIPNIGNLQLSLYIPTPLSAFVTLFDTILFPPGWEEAVRYNLCVRICPEFGKPIDPVVAKIAVDSFALIQRANKRLQDLEVDSALVGVTNRGVFNWLSGQPGGYRS
jgi:hypothetical protein